MIDDKLTYMLPNERKPEVILKNAQDVKLYNLDLACGNDITAGFVSSALGIPHMYDCGAIDQVNLVGTLLSTMLPTFDGVVPIRVRPVVEGVVDSEKITMPHDKTQIIQMVTGMYEHILAKRMKYWELEQLVKRAEALEAVGEVQRE